MTVATVIACMITGATVGRAGVVLARRAWYVGPLFAHSIFFTTAFCIAFIGTAPVGTGVGAGVGAGVGPAVEVAAVAGGASVGNTLSGSLGASPAAMRTSSAVMRPKLPVPLIEERSNFFAFASFFASGVATRFFDT